MILRTSVFLTILLFSSYSNALFFDDPAYGGTSSNSKKDNTDALNTEDKNLEQPHETDFKLTAVNKHPPQRPNSQRKLPPRNNQFGNFQNKPLNNQQFAQKRPSSTNSFNHQVTNHDSGGNSDFLDRLAKKYSDGGIRTIDDAELNKHKKGGNQQMWNQNSNIQNPQRDMNRKNWETVPQNNQRQSPHQKGIQKFHNVKKFSSPNNRRPPFHPNKPVNVNHKNYGQNNRFVENEDSQGQFDNSDYYYNYDTYDNEGNFNPSNQVPKRRRKMFGHRKNKYKRRRNDYGDLEDYDMEEINPDDDPPSTIQKDKFWYLNQENGACPSVTWANVLLLSITLGINAYA